MNKNLLSGIAATTFVASLAFTAPASAAVTFDPATGTGFVGKGDVQLAYDWNDATLQANATGVTFAAVSEIVTEVTWECTVNASQTVQEKERTTTTSTSGVFSSVTRDNKKKVNGFNLTGYSSDTSGSTTEGQQPNTCGRGATLTKPAGDPVELSNTSVVTATFNGDKRVL